MKRLSLIIAVLLAGCSGGGADVSLPPPPTETQIDAFFAIVSGVVSASSEDGDAKDIDALAPTSPDGSDPETL
jgi:hypothetical protein